MRGKLPTENDFWNLIEQVKKEHKNDPENMHASCAKAMGKNYPYRKFMYDLFEKKKSELHSHLVLEPLTSAVVLEGKDFYSKIKREKTTWPNEELDSLEHIRSTQYMWAFLSYEDECPFQITTYDGNPS